MAKLSTHRTTIEMTVCGVTSEFNLTVTYRRIPAFPAEYEPGGRAVSPAERENAEIVSVILELSPGFEIGFYTYLSDEQVAAIIEEILE